MYSYSANTQEIDTKHYKCTLCQHLFGLISQNISWVAYEQQEEISHILDSGPEWS